MSSLKKNLGYQTAYQILTTFLPLITAPYLSRKLGATQLGIFSYTQSIVAYFTLFAMLGFSTYGTRSIAAVKNDKEKLNKEFCSLYSLQIITSVIALSVYAIYLLSFCKDNKIIAFIQLFEIAGCLLNINWLFFGLEKFKITVMRNTIIRVLTVALILLLVKSENDLWIYTLLMVGSNVLSQAVLWVYVPKFIKIVKFSKQDIIRHIKPVIVLFIPIAAMTVYHIMDKTMLGLISGYTQSGYYYNADKVVNITVGIISGFGTVFMPRVAALVGENKIKEADNLFLQSLKATIFIASPLTFGIASVAYNFVPIFFGKGYSECISLIIVLSPVLIIKGFAFSVRYQYLIPRENDAIYIKSILLGVIVNLILNSVLIPRLGAMGAVLGTLFAELSACIVQFVSIRKLVDYKKTVMQCFIYILMGLIMYLCVIGINKLLASGFVALLVEIIVGIIVYILLSFIYLKMFNDTEMKKIVFDTIGKYIRRK